jgi:hypothetical protein
MRKHKMLVTLAVVILLSIMAIVAQCTSNDDQDIYADADKIRAGCKPTYQYTIDDFDRVRRVYDCTEKP